MRNTIVLTSILFTSLFSYGGSTADAINQIMNDTVKKCYDDITTNLSISLSQAYHGVENDESAESAALEKLENFNKDKEELNLEPALESCSHSNSNIESGCIEENYASVTAYFITKYKMSFEKGEYPDCGYILPPDVVTTGGVNEVYIENGVAKLRVVKN